MSRRAWLLLAWGILILTVVDGTRFFGLPPYAAYEHGQTQYEGKYEEHGPERPVLSVLIKTFDAVNTFVTTYETLLIVLSTIAIAAFTATLWRATTGLQEMAGKQAEDMRKSLLISKRAADAAAASAKAAQDTAATMANTAERQLRAYVHPNPDHKVTVSGDIFSATFTIKNFGQTPAEHFKCCVFASLVKPDAKGDFPISYGDEPSESPLAPGSHVTAEITLRTILNETEIRALNSGDAAIAVWGEVSYFSFGEECRTGFRYICSGEDWVRCRLKVCSDGNYAT